MPNKLFIALFSTLLVTACAYQATNDNVAETPAPSDASKTTTPAQVAEKPAEPAIPEDRITLTVFDPNILRLSCTQVLTQARAGVRELETFAPNSANSASLLDQWDAMGAAVEDAIGPIYLQAYVHPNKAVRDAGEACINQITQFETELYQNTVLYQLVSAIKPTEPAAQKLREDLLNSFVEAGVNLPLNSRERVRDLTQKIQKLNQEFQRNLRENQEKLSFTEAEIAGIPAEWLAKAERDEAGNVLVGFDYPHYFPFMRNVHSSQARYRYMLGFHTRGGKRNLEILNEIVTLRKQVATLHGVPSFAHKVTRNRMVENPATVHNFLNDVLSHVQTAEANDLAALTSLKAATENTPVTETTLQRWDLDYYLEKLRQQRFAINQEELRAHFPTTPTVNWVMDLSSRLYDIQFVERPAPVWHPDVRYFDVYEANNSFIGGIYLDLYPRDGKYKHAAAFGVRGGSTLLQRKPISVLVTNFDRVGLTHRELETLFHEFGHVLHGVLSNTTYLAHAGTSVMRDFVEAPSQMFEEWARQYASLATLAESCTSCKPINKALVDRLNAARRFGRGITYARQHLYASYDMALAGANPLDAMEQWKIMEAQTALGHTAGTEFPGTFAHIAGGYAAGYYGYMWSEVLALDMLSAFGNPLDIETGRRYRQTILSRGGEEKPTALVEKFLGRPANPNAFFQEISGQRGIKKSLKKE